MALTIADVPLPLRSSMLSTSAREAWEESSIDRLHHPCVGRTDARGYGSVDVTGFLPDARCFPFSERSRGRDRAGELAGQHRRICECFVVGWMPDLTHSNIASLLFSCSLVSLGAILVLMIPGSLVNK